MIKVFFYSLLMILGMMVSQVFDISSFRPILNFCLIVILGYIMIEVGLEFTIQKNNLKSYGKDYLIAMTAATLPWLFCSFYFWSIFDVDFSGALIIGRFAAPTSAGILFTMLAAAGLATTWVFKKARILAIFDDLDTVLLIIPLQLIHIGWQWKAGILLFLIGCLLVVAYRFLHTIKLPITRPFLLLYSLLLVLITECLEKTSLIQLEILLPAFVLGCILYNPHSPEYPLIHQKEHQFLEPQEKWQKRFDAILKFSYMFLVGCSLPKLELENLHIGFLVFHLSALLFLSNFGKLYPLFCYKKEASLRERTALAIAMWPRGEVGAGIIIISMHYAIKPIVIELAQLSIAVNLTLTGLFIFIVVWLLKGARRGPLVKS